MDVFNWKKAVETNIKPPGQWHSQFSTAERISLLKKQNSQGIIEIVVKGEVNYRSDLGIYKPVFKRGKSLANLILEPLPKQYPVKMAKLNDVDALLKKNIMV